LEPDNEILIKEKEALLEKLSGYDNPGSGTIGAPRSGLQRTDPGKKTNFFGIKNIVITLLSIAVIALIAYPAFIKKNSIVQKDKGAPASLNKSTPNEGDLQLKKAREFLMNGRVDDARLIYKALAIREIPEAMYEYGNLLLLNENDKSSCIDGVEYLKRAVGKGYAPAKRTLGFLYSYAGDSIALKQKGYGGCSFNFDIPRGSKLLMEAMLQGDTIAGSLLDELNAKYKAH